MEIMYNHIWSEHNCTVTWSSTYVIQLHVSALGIGHLQVVHNLSISYTIYEGFTLDGGRDLVLQYWEAWPCNLHHCTVHFVESFNHCSAHGLLPGFPGLQPAQQVLKTIRSNIRSYAPEDGHNDGRNILS